jgi:hypothetical protein
VEVIEKYENRPETPLAASLFRGRPNFSAEGPIIDARAVSGPANGILRQARIAIKGPAAVANSQGSSVIFQLISTRMRLDNL